MSYFLGLSAHYHHVRRPNGVEVAVDSLPRRETACLVLRMRTGLADEPRELAGVNQIVERTLSKGTRQFDGRGLADAFDAIGADFSTYTGRQSVILRIICLPEFVSRSIELAAEMFCHPTFPDEACRVAVDLSRQELKSSEDDPGEVNRRAIQRLTLGDVYGREPTGELATLDRITPEDVRAHWRKQFRASRLQVCVAGPVDPQSVCQSVDRFFAKFGDPAIEPPGPVQIDFSPRRQHQHKDLQQQQIAITLRGSPRDDPRFPVEQALIAVLSGGMSGRLFTEVREKLGLVYWVSAWHEQLPGVGFIHVRAASTPERCRKTYRTLLREIRRLSEDLEQSELDRARHGLIAHALTNDDVTRQRAAALSEDIFFHQRPIGLAPKIAALEKVTLDDVQTYAASFSNAAKCVATLGPAEFDAD